MTTRRNSAPLTHLSALPAAGLDTLVLSSRFRPESKPEPMPARRYEPTEDSRNLLTEAGRVLKVGGLLFVYGTPHGLAVLGDWLSAASFDEFRMVFKYWIALDIDDSPRSGTLSPAHQGVLMFVKSEGGNRPPASFHVNTATVRIPHATCSACGKFLKDWGGKSHLMNPLGAAMSDVWRDLPKTRIRGHVVPNVVLDRLRALTERADAAFLHLVQTKPAVRRVSSKPGTSPTRNSQARLNFSPLESNTVHEGDCLAFLERVAELHPEGVFDLAFADPPYNIKKEYSSYDDGIAERRYLDWCNRWLAGMVRTLKPGGALVVLNMPKWAMRHAAYLNQFLEFRHWIVWDALSDPRGKIMPAHYSLLYYTKPGGASVFNYAPDGTESPDCAGPTDAPTYCLRAKCLKARKQALDDRKAELSDVWFDIHRIKHKRDRDSHPCQLPEKLMERVILLTTPKNGLVFDPFCGAGTTAVAARKLGRRYVTIDLDPEYVRIASKKLAEMEQAADLFGSRRVPRQSVKKVKSEFSKRAIETALQQLAWRLGRTPSEQDIVAGRPELLDMIDAVYPTRNAALKRCRVVLQ